jgi:hypothetical protein
MTTATQTHPKLSALQEQMKPEPGTWRPTQTLAGKVLQYAWTCLSCKRTEFVMDSPRAMALGATKTEVCPCTRTGKGRRILDERVSPKIRREKGVLGLRCDGPECKATTKDIGVFRHHRAFLDALAANGWLVAKEDGKWVHACPECRKEAAKGL